MGAVVSIFYLFFALGAVSYIVDNIDYTILEKGLSSITNNETTDEKAIHEIVDLIGLSTNNKAFNVVVDIKSSSTSNLTAKNIDIKLKYPIITRYIYVNDNTVFTILTNKDKESYKDIEITRIR